METSAYQELASLEHQHWWFVGRRKIIDALLSRLSLKEGARILEVGCGTGGNLEMLNRYGKLYAGEYNDAARAVALGKNVTEEIAHCELPDDLPFEGEQFDLIVLFDVLEHVENDRASLKAIHLRLKPEGWLVITVPAFAFLWSGHDVRHHHFRRYTRAELEGLLDTEGFQIGYAGYFDFWLFPVVALIRFAKNLAFGRDQGPNDTAMPPRVINRLLTWLFSSERYAMGRFSLPFGVSCIVSARPVVGAA
ncbi:MAG: class I SAM-dependent methyltransferase [Hyphomicrobiales bacterium]|nr:class I SAM-dependent methyltransferase [Hyphomicrobiales bacterium]